jgi:hypothetical protein
MAITRQQARHGTPVTWRGQPFTVHFIPFNSSAYPPSTWRNIKVQCPAGDLHTAPLAELELRRAQ